MRYWKWILLFIVIAALIGLSFLPQTLPVDMGEVAVTTLEITVEEDGKTQVRDRYTVHAPVSGMLRRTKLRAGDKLLAGDTVLAVIEPHLPAFLDARGKAETEARVKGARAARDQAKQHLQSAKTSLAFAEKELNRLRDLGTIVSSESLDNAAYTLDLRKSEEAAARKALRVAEFELESQMAALKAWPASGENTAAPLTLRAPIDGEVFRVFQESSGPVVAGAALLEIADRKRLEMVVDLLSRDAVKVRAGQKVMLRRWGGADDLVGKVRLVEPSGFTKISALGVEEQRVNVLIDFVGPEAAWAGLGDGFRVEAAIVIWEKENVLTVPGSALFWEDEQWFVYRVQNNRAQRTPVTLGRRNAHLAEVREGLDSGDRVVLHPSDQVEDGAKVEKRN